MDQTTADAQLDRIKHIVVLMLENRSFDHMLGYLSLPPGDGGRGRDDIDGQAVPYRTNVVDGETVTARPEDQPGSTKIQDPGHEGWQVSQQMTRGMSGFATNYVTTRAYQQAGDVMKFQTADNLPVYDFLAANYAVLDRWFCSTPGATWPNRLAALTGESKSRDNKLPPIYDRHSFVRVLRDRTKASWRWYSYDPGSLRLVDGQFRVRYEDHFAFVEKPSLIQKRTFFQDALGGELPNVSWIDPNFVDLGGLQGANDDHPPTDLMAGQSLIAKLYAALSQSPQWDTTMFVIVYDEHGGFYDHVDPSAMPDDFRRRAEFGGEFGGLFGPRVPAIVVSPLVEAGVAFGSHQGEAGRPYLFDHTALIRTILKRFANDSTGDLEDGPAKRIASSNHLGWVLTNTGGARDPVPLPDTAVNAVTGWWGARIGYRLRNPMADSPALRELGVVPGPTGTLGALQGVWGLVAKIRDKIAALLGRARKDRGDPEPPTEGTGPPAAVIAEATELQEGVARAAKHIRDVGKLPSGQP